MIVSRPLLVISSIAKFCVNFNFNIIVLFVVLSSILIIASPDISSMNGASAFINLCSLGFSTICSFGKKWKGPVQEIEAAVLQIYNTFQLKNIFDA